MKKIQRLILAGCMTLAGLCSAQEPQPQDYYAVIDISDFWGAKYDISYTNAPPDEGWTNDPAMYLKRRLVLQQFIKPPSDRYFVSVFKVTNGQNAMVTDQYGDWDNPNDYDPLSVSTTTVSTINAFLAALTGKGIDTNNIFASASSNEYTELRYPVSSESFYVYLKTDYLLSVNGGTVIGGTDNVYTNGGETVSITADNPDAFVKWLVYPPADTNDFGTAFDETAYSTDLVMPFYDVKIAAYYEYKLLVHDGSGSGVTYRGPTGQVHGIMAVLPVDPEMETFAKWTVTPLGLETQLGALFEPTDTNTFVTIPAADVTVTATYTNLLYKLTVVNGTGDGDYIKGKELTVTANPPQTGFEFECWADAVGVTVLSPVSSLSLDVKILGNGPASVTAVYKPVKVRQNTYMVVDLGGSGATNYLEEAPLVNGKWTDEYRTGKMVFRKVPAGSFAMGSPANEPGRQSDETQHRVTLTKDFYLGIFEVTQAQWQNVSDDPNPSQFTGDDKRPVERVTYEAVRGSLADANWPTKKEPTSGSFMGKLSSKAGLDVDLPTEAQWEYACRADSGGAHATSQDRIISEMAWYEKTVIDGKTRPVGGKRSNDWGFYDMHGNVFEMCLDWWVMNGDPGSAEQTDPPGPSDLVGLPTRVMRGGAYYSTDAQIRSAFRLPAYVTNYVTGGNTEIKSNAYSYIGFRVAVSQETASYQLTVEGGVVNTGGMFPVGTPIGLMAAPAPAGQEFRFWQVTPNGLDLGAGFNANADQTLLTMPSTNVTVAAYYMPTGTTGPFYLTVNYPSGAVTTPKYGGEPITLTAPAPAPWYQFTGWTVSPAGAFGSAPLTAETLNAKMPAHDVTVTPNYSVQALITPTVGVTFTVDASAGLLPASFTAKGLPAGLKLNRMTGVISGIPTKAGTFNVQVTAKRADGTTETYTIPITVQALPENAQGTFTGYLVVDGGSGVKQMRGLVTFKVSARGALSAKVDTQSGAYSFSAKSWDTASGSLFGATLSHRQGRTLTLELDATTGALTSASTFNDGVPGAATFDVYAQRNAFMDRNNLAVQSKLSVYKGYYTVALPMVSIVTDASGVNNTQSGSGYLTVTIRDRGAVKSAGKLADGTRVSGSTTLIVDGSDAYVPLFTKLYSRRGVFAGLLQISGTAAPALHVEDVSDTRLEWIYPGRSASMAADRFDAQLDACGAFYDTLADLQAAYVGMAFKTEEDFGWPALLVISGNSGSLALPQKGTPENPDGVTLKAVKRTGLFSGSFKIADATTGKNVTLKHAGVLTRIGADYVGEGSYIRSKKDGSYTLKSSYWVEIAP